MLSSTTFLTTVASPAPFLFEKEIKLPSIKLYYHLVLETEGGELDDERSLKFRQFVAAYARAKGGSLKAAACAQGKVFLLVGLDYTVSLADFVRDLKLVSRTFARKKLDAADFAYGDRFDAFTVSLSQLGRVQGYISRQTRLEKQESYASSWHPVTLGKNF